MKAMREIKFRGKGVTYNEWRFGSLKRYIDKNREPVYAILEETEGGGIYAVIPETIGQFTGLKDMAGDDIFEGDVLCTRRRVFGMPLDNGKAAEIFPQNEMCREVIWDEYLLAEFKITEDSVSFSTPKNGPLYQDRGKVMIWEIIGNIFDNPELKTKIQNG